MDEEKRKELMRLALTVALAALAAQPESGAVCNPFGYSHLKRPRALPASSPAVVFDNRKRNTSAPAPVGVFERNCDLGLVILSGYRTVSKEVICVSLEGLGSTAVAAEPAKEHIEEVAETRGLFAGP